MNKNFTATLMPINNAKYLSLLDQVMLLLIVITLQDIYIFNNLFEIHSLQVLRLWKKNVIGTVHRWEGRNIPKTSSLILLYPLLYDSWHFDGKDLSSWHDKSSCRDYLLLLLVSNWLFSHQLTSSGGIHWWKSTISDVNFSDLLV